MYEKPLYPSYVMRITQQDNQGTHIDSYAIDEAGIDQGISIIYAPFSGIIKKIYKEDANEIWFESLNPVEYADGTIDYMTIMFAHKNDVNELFVGKKIKQGEKLYAEGTKGQATGNHCHIECGRGRFVGTGWHKNKIGYFSINNGKRIDECLWINDNIQIVNCAKYKFKKIPTDNEIKNNDSSIQNTTDEETIKNKLIYKATKDGLYGIYLKKDDILILK